ncbi:MAG: hypothetical protein K8I60_13455, partial [Anaerolineae bacterium]|nr:hypothetical protein [Anaerolineae bacterium]
MSEEQQIRVFVDTLLCLFKDGLSRPILTTYKQTYSGANYMWHVRNALKSDNYTFNAAIFKNEAVLLGQLEPYGWLRLMRRQWRLFQGKLGKAGKKHLDGLYDIRNKWAHHDEITVENAISAAEAAIFLLDAYGAKEVTEARDIHRALMDLQIRQSMPENLPRATQEASSDMDLNILPPFKPSPPANGLD